MLDSLAMPSLLAVFWQFLVTTLLFPFAHRLIDRFEDADVRFR
jgi:rod shape-determining protein MreD